MENIGDYLFENPYNETGTVTTSYNETGFNSTQDNFNQTNDQLGILMEAKLPSLLLDGLSDNVRFLPILIFCNNQPLFFSNQFLKSSTSVYQ